MAAIKPGFSADGTFIENPTKLLEESVPGLTGAARMAAVTKVAPTFRILEGTSLASGMLSETPTEKTVQELPRINLSRVSASGAALNCWFDSFLQCMSPKYRSLDLARRNDIRVGFRKYLGQEKVLNAILAQKPALMNHPALDFTDAKFINDIRLETKNAKGTIIQKDLDYTSGFLIAWYFGVNLIYLKRLHFPKEDRYDLDVICETSYQSPDCKTIIMCNIGGYHFEPVGKVVLTDDSKLLEGEGGSKFLFSWEDKELCSLKEFNNTLQCDLYPKWSAPTICTVGGRRGRIRRKTRKLTKRTRKTKKSRRA
jgi:hypothetical protein